MEWNWVDLAAGFVLLFGLVGGVLKGFTWQIVRVVFLVLAFVLASRYCGWLGIQLGVISNSKIGPPLDKSLAYILLFGFVYVGSWPLALLLRSVIAKMKLKSYDRVFGGLLGFLKGTAVCYVVFVALAYFVPKVFEGGSWLEEELGTSITSTAVAQLDPVVNGVFPDEFHQRVAELRDAVDSTIDEGRDQQSPLADPDAPGDEGAYPPRNP